MKWDRGVSINRAIDGSIRRLMMKGLSGLPTFAPQRSFSAVAPKGHTALPKSVGPVRSFSIVVSNDRTTPPKSIWTLRSFNTAGSRDGVLLSKLPWVVQSFGISMPKDGRIVRLSSACCSSAKPTRPNAVIGSFVSVTVFTRPSLADGRAALCVGN